MAYPRVTLKALLGRKSVCKVYKGQGEQGHPDDKQDQYLRVENKKLIFQLNLACDKLKCVH